MRVCKGLDACDGFGGDYLGRDLGPDIYDIGLKIMMLFQVMGGCLILEPLRSLSRLFTDMKTAGNILFFFSLFSGFCTISRLC